MARRDKAAERGIARGRIKRLVRLAKEACQDGRLEDAQRYGELAWRLKNRYVLPALDPLKQRVCRSCYSYLLPGKTARTRLTEGKISTTCLLCGTVRRVPLVRERKAKRQGSPSAPDPR